jgi:hypothetical protein
MRPTFDTLVSIFESHPDAAYAQRVSGLTAAQVAAQLLSAMDKAPSTDARDRIFSHAMAAAGVYTSGIDAFDKGSEEMIERTHSRSRIADEAQRMSADSRQTPQFVAPERIAHLAQVAAKASLQQGLADRLRSRDREQARHEVPMLLSSPRLAEHAADTSDRRAALHAAVAATPDDDMIRLPQADNVRDALSNAWDMHADIADAADPLDDQGLRDLSNAV